MSQITQTGLPPLSERLSLEEFERLRLDEGLSYRQIGSRYEVAKETVAKFARTAGSELRSRAGVMRAYRQRLVDTDDGSQPAWAVAAEVHCGENLVRTVRKERGMTDCVTYAAPDVPPCPRCTFPPNQENPMIGWACLLCWCDILSDPDYVPLGQRVRYVEAFCESGLAVRAGLVPEA